MVNLANAFRGEASAFQANLIHPIGVRVPRGGRHGKWQDILRDGRPSPHVRVRTDAHILMHRAERTHHRPLFDSYMPAQRCSIHQHAMVADHAVMADMSISHDQSMIANSGEAAALHRTAVDSDALANLVVVANLQTRWFASVRNI